MKLRPNGLEEPPDFPTAPYEAIYQVMEARHAGHTSYVHFAGAWNALAYRFRATTDCASAFTDQLKRFGASPEPAERYLQEDTLFRIYGSAFSVFECTAYGLFAIGSIVAPSRFPITTPEDQQRITPKSMCDKFVAEFPREPLSVAVASMLKDPGYTKTREIRNILTHRAAPGRMFYVSFGGEEQPTEWKLNNVVLDDTLGRAVRADVSRITATVLAAAQTFAASRL